ncbi:MAG TPA: hypothetical protein VFB84_04725 [Micromonosporaceae bacterium]|nr:hypothetical protein [Micromonosporaceae bacterium]
MTPPDRILYLDEAVTRQVCSGFDALHAVRRVEPDLATAPRTADDGLTMVLDIASRRMVCVISAGFLGQLAAASAVVAAARDLVHGRVLTAGLIGTDVTELVAQALTGLPTLVHAAVYTPHLLRARLATARVPRPRWRPGTTLTVVATAQEAVLGADVVLVTSDLRLHAEVLSPSAVVVTVADQPVTGYQVIHLVTERELARAGDALAVEIYRTAVRRGLGTWLAR